MVLPEPGGPIEQDVVPARRGDLEGPLDVVLALDFLEIQVVGRTDEKVFRP